MRVCLPVVLPIVLLCSLSTEAPAQAVAPAYESNPRFQDAVKDAVRVGREQPVFAAEAWKKANKIAGGACVRCLNEEYKAQLRFRDLKGAVQTAKELEALAGTPVDKSVAELKLGTALYDQAGDKPRPEQLQAAHQALQAAIKDYSKNLSARFTDGCVLAQMGKTDEARDEFAACAAAASPNDPSRTRALHFAENPELSTHHMAPPIVVKAADGTRFNLDEMQGRVVLVDFWATWCGPCNEELPHLQKIVKEFSGQPLTVISISWDSDESKWREFISKHEMTWVQFRDADHSLSNQFGVPSIPHYFLIDSDGVLYPQMLGAESDVAGKIRKFLARAGKAKPAGTTEVAAGN